MENQVTTNAEGTATEPKLIGPLVCGQPCGTPSTTDNANTNQANESEKTNVSN